MGITEEWSLQLFTISWNLFTGMSLKLFSADIKYNLQYWHWSYTDIDSVAWQRNTKHDGMSMRTWDWPQLRDHSSLLIPEHLAGRQHLKWVSITWLHDNNNTDMLLKVWWACTQSLILFNGWQCQCYTHNYTSLHVCDDTATTRLTNCFCKKIIFLICPV